MPEQTITRHVNLQGFAIACSTGWIVLCAAGALYARAKNIPLGIAVPVVAAFLFEYVFYLAPGFEAVRDWCSRRFTALSLAPLLIGSAILPYLVYSFGTGQFRLSSFGILLAIACAASLWFVLFPPGPAADIGLIALLAGIFLSKILRQIYPPPFPQVRLEVLGHLMLIRLGASALLMQRRFTGLRFGFVPSRREWLVGLRFFVYFLPVGLPLGWLLGIVTFHGQPGPAWQAVGIFLGILWVVALSEEFVFRGVLQAWLTRATGSPLAALLVASVCFGLCHLWFRGFPNWRMVAFATVAGLFWGQAFRAGGVRASMVSHALVVTTWLKWLS